MSELHVSDVDQGHSILFLLRFLKFTVCSHMGCKTSTNVMNERIFETVSGQVFGAHSVFSRGLYKKPNILYISIFWLIKLSVKNQISS